MLIQINGLVMQRGQDSLYSTNPLKGIPIRRPYLLERLTYEGIQVTVFFTYFFLQNFAHTTVRTSG